MGRKIRSILVFVKRLIFPRGLELEDHHRADEARALFRLLNVCPPSGSLLNPLATQAD
jgi:hypothetical protein